MYSTVRPSSDPLCELNSTSESVNDFIIMFMNDDFRCEFRLSYTVASLVVIAERESVEGIPTQTVKWRLKKTHFL